MPFQLTALGGGWGSAPDPGIKIIFLKIGSELIFSINCPVCWVHRDLLLLRTLLLPTADQRSSKGAPS